MPKLLVDEQIKRLYRSGLLDHVDSVQCTISGKYATRMFPFVSLYKDWLEVIDLQNSDDNFEGFTLQYLHESCCTADDDDPDSHVLYFHTKGMSQFCGLSRYPQKWDTQSRLPAVNSWRKMMETAVIDRWQENIQQLDNGFQVSGVNYTTWFWPHMSGNFWWARADYIKSLPHPLNDPLPPWTGKPYDQFERLQFERWIGLNDPKVHSFHNIDRHVLSIHQQDLYPHLDWVV